MSLPRGLRAFAHPDFRIWYATQIVALVAGWMQSVAQSWLVLQLTDSPIRLGFIGTLQFGPVLLFSVVSGALADRLPKRGVLVGTQSAYVVYALVTSLLVATGTIQYWHVCVIAVAGGLTNALDMPTRQAFYVDMVGKDDVTNAVALSSAAFNAARIVGPALGGLLIARVGVAPAFVVNALATLLVVVTLLPLRAARTGEPRRRCVPRSRRASATHGGRPSSCSCSVCSPWSASVSSTSPCPSRSWPATSWDSDRRDSAT